MIMQNISKETTNVNNYSKTFTNILHEAQKHWTEIEYDASAKTARGAMFVDGRLIVAIISFDDAEDRLTLTARLPLKKELNMSAMRQILRYQNLHRNFSSFLSVDDESHIASVWSNASVYKERPSLAVACIFNDTYKLLEDTELNELLN